MTNPREETDEYVCTNGHDLCYGGTSAGPDCPYCERRPSPKEPTMTRYADGHPHRQGAMIEDEQTKAPDAKTQFPKLHSAGVKGAAIIGKKQLTEVTVAPDEKGEETVDGFRSDQIKRARRMIKDWVPETERGREIILNEVQNILNEEPPAAPLTKAMEGKK